MGAALFAGMLVLAPGCDGTADPDPDPDAGGAEAGGASGGTDADAGGGVCEYPPEADGVPDFPAPDFDCVDDPFSLTFAQGVIGTLAQSAWGGRKFGTPGLSEARDWIREQFECVGLTPGAPSLPGAPSGTFDQPFKTRGDAMNACDISGWSYVGDGTGEGGQAHDFTNVIGSIEGTGDLAHEVVVVGAHMDHMGHYGVEGNQIVLGADDNASGILALLSLAKSLVESPQELADRRTVVFVAWGIEEDPFYLRGSRAFFEQLEPGSAEQIVYYVNFDMIGRYSDDGAVYALGAYEGSPAETIIQARAGEYGSIEIGLGSRGQSSDHVTFCENEIPYTFFWAQSDCYHKPCDTPDAIDYDHLPDILRAGRDLVADLSGVPDLLTPKSRFASDYTEAYPGLGNLAETCGFQEE